MIILPGKPLLLHADSCQRWLSFEPPEFRAKNHDGVCVISVHGVLTKRAAALDGVLGATSYESISSEFSQALNSDAHTIIFDIDSPGGETAGLFDLCDRIYTNRGSKNLWAVANDDCFSAAYAIASSCDKVFLNRTSGVGSIGVIAHHVDQSKYDEQQGVKYKTIFAGQRKNDGNPHEPLTEDSTQSLKNEVNRLYEMFLSLVSRNRQMPVEKVRSTEAALFYGDDAITSNLADKIMTLTQVIKLAKENSMDNLNTDP